MRKTLYGLVLCAAGATCHLASGGGNVTAITEFTPSPNVTLESADSSGNVKIQIARGYASIKSIDTFLIDPSKSYSLRGEFKSEGTYPSILYFGFVPIGENGEEIQSHEINPIPGTETQLAAPCTPEDTVIKLADCSRWDLTTSSSLPIYGYVAYDVDVSGKYPDLPHKKCIGGPGLPTKKQNGAVWELMLNKKCGVALPAGTKVRAQCASNNYIYASAAGVKAPNQWTTYEGETSGIVEYGAKAGHFWRGTKSVKVVILANYGQQKDWVLAIKNITLTESLPPPLSNSKKSGDKGAKKPNPDEKCLPKRGK